MSIRVHSGLPRQYYVGLKIGIYGGSFDPIHHGHLILAREARERIGLDKVIFIPAAVSPFKTRAATDGEVRLAMVRAAIENEPGFTADDCELKRLPPSYTIDTVADIAGREPGAELYCLIGDDNVRDLPKWHLAEELKERVHFIVLDRSGHATKHDYPVIGRKIDISATEIRKRVASGRSIRYLVPTAVEEIIRRENLYLEPLK